MDGHITAGCRFAVEQSQSYGFFLDAPLAQDMKPSSFVSAGFSLPHSLAMTPAHCE
jgi:hypothetical protein